MTSMPTYTSHCSNCGYTQDYVCKVDQRNDTPTCCVQPMERKLTAPMVGAMGIADHAAVRSPIDGSMLYGKSDYDRHLKKHGALPESDLIGEAAHQRKQTDDADRKQRHTDITESLAKHGA